jgi:hypothetical protein
MDPRHERGIEYDVGWRRATERFDGARGDLDRQGY